MKTFDYLESFRTDILRDDFIDEVAGLLYTCRCDVYDLTRNWSTNDLGKLLQSEWDATQPYFDAISTNLSVNAHKLSKLTGPTIVDQKLRSMTYRASGDPETKAHLVASLTSLYREAQSTREQIEPLTGASGEVGKNPAQVDPAFINAILSIDYATASIIHYLEPIVNPIATTDKSLSPNEHTKQIKYSSLSELFLSGSEAKCVEALRKYRPERPVIDADNQWKGRTGKDKGIIVAWIDAMERARPSKIVNLPGTPRKELVRLLNSYFQGLNMGKDARVFSDPADPRIVEILTSLL